MANTKNLSREQRKAAKRRARRSLKQAWTALTAEQRKQFKKSGEKSLKKFLASLKAQEKSAPPAGAKTESTEQASETASGG